MRSRIFTGSARRILREGVGAFAIEVMLLPIVLVLLDIPVKRGRENISLINYDMLHTLKVALKRYRLTSFI